MSACSPFLLATDDCGRTSLTSMNNSARCRSDINTAIDGDASQSMEKQVTQVLFKSDLTHRCVITETNNRKQNTCHQSLTHCAPLQNGAVLEHKIKYSSWKAIA